MVNIVLTSPLQSISQSTPQPLNYDSNEHVTIFDSVDSVQQFPEIYSPLKEDSVKTDEYKDFIHQLYRFDKEKHIVLRRDTTVQEANEADEVKNNIRKKRTLIFRPVFVYKQQQIKKQKVIAAKKKIQEQKKQQVASSSVPANSSPHFVDSNNREYQQYNPYYYPYQYGQRYPYRGWMTVDFFY